MVRRTVVFLLLAGLCLSLSTFAFAGAPKPPSMPTSLVATAVSSTQIDLTWIDNANNETGFRIQRKVGVSGTYEDLDTVGPNVQYYPDTTCGPGTEYCYRVLAFNGYGDSDWSNEDCATTSGSGTPPAAPTSLDAAAVSSTKIDLTWVDNANNEDGFLIQRKIGVGGTFEDLDTVGPNTVGYGDTTCSPETTYCYQVRAYNTYGDSAWSNEDCDTTPEGSALGHGIYLYHNGEYTQYSTAQLAYDAAVPGDEVVFGPGLYHDFLRLNKSGTATDPIVVRGEGYPRPVVSGETFGKNTLPYKRSLFGVTGSYNVIENLELKNASSEWGHNQSTSGVYLTGTPSNVVIRNCFIHDCGHGIYNSNDSAEWTIEYNECCYNGYWDDPYYHNAYVYGWGPNYVRYNTWHHAKSGLGYKDRSKDIYFLYNTVFDNGLYEVDFMLGDSSYGPQDTTMVGNWVLKNPNASNSTIFIGFIQRQGGTLTAVNNYFQANHPSNTFINVDTQESCVAHNNIFDNHGYSGLNIFRDGAGLSLTGTNNWCATSATYLGNLTNTVFGTAPGVIDSVDGNFHLAAGSQCIDAGNSSAGPLPDKEPVYPSDWTTRNTSGAIDIGPYEYSASTAVAPLPVTGLTGTPQSSTSVLLQWTNRTDLEDGFIIMRLSDETVGWVEIDTAAAGSTSYLDDTVSGGTLYLYRVRTYNATGVGGHSNEVRVTTP